MWSHHLTVICLITVLLPLVMPFGWYRFGDRCFVTGDSVYLERWKMEKCTNYTEVMLFQDAGLIKVQDDAFKDLTTKFLSLDNNKLREIGPWITPLTSLQYFSITHNRIKKLTDRMMSQQKQLQMLILNHNEISFIEQDALEGLVYIDYIGLSNNQLKEIKNEFRHLVDMLQIDLSHNQISHVEEGAFVNNTKLREVHLSYNKLKVLPYNFFLRNQLKRIYLTENYLTKVDFLENCVNMDTLDISNNKLTKVNFINMLKLNTLYMHDNELDHTNVKEIVANLSTTLDWISFNKNKFTCSGLIELWSELSNNKKLNLMTGHDYKTAIKINEIGCQETYNGLFDAPPFAKKPLWNHVAYRWFV